MYVCVCVCVCVCLLHVLCDDPFSCAVLALATISDLGVTSRPNVSNTRCESSFFFRRRLPLRLLRMRRLALVDILEMFLPDLPPTEATLSRGPDVVEPYLADLSVELEGLTRDPGLRTLLPFGGLSADIFSLSLSLSQEKTIAGNV